MNYTLLRGLFYALLIEAIFGAFFGAVIWFASGGA